MEHDRDLEMLLGVIQEMRDQIKSLEKTAMNLEERIDRIESRFVVYGGGSYAN